MAAHLTEIHQAIKKNKHKDWNSIIKKIKDQIVLRSLTCIQLANKFSNSKNVIKLSSIQDLLIELGYKFSFESILNSELRVLKYLDFRLNILTPYNVVETLLEILGHNLKNSQPKALYIISIRLLESFYFCKEQIYKRLYESFSGKAKDHTERQFKPQTFTTIVVIFYFSRKQLFVLENDYLYLASALISASAHVLNHKDSNYNEMVIYCGKIL